MATNNNAQVGVYWFKGLPAPFGQTNAVVHDTGQGLYWFKGMPAQPVYITQTLGVTYFINLTVNMTNAP
jgi:hypothetical protein